MGKFTEVLPATKLAQLLLDHRAKMGRTWRGSIYTFYHILWNVFVSNSHFPFVLSLPELMPPEFASTCTHSHLFPLSLCVSAWSKIRFVAKPTASEQIARHLSYFLLVTFHVKAHKPASSTLINKHCETK